MSLVLKTLLQDVLDKSGIQQKKEIQDVAHALANAVGNADHPNGDDAAAIKTINGYDLLAAEGFMPSFVQQDPWFAGWCGVMVNISDIAAMGGRPTAITNTIWSDDKALVKKIFEGMAAASHAFNIPIVGGHTNLNAQSTQLGVSIFGKANSLLSSFAAKPGHALVCAIDLRGAFRKPFLNWNAATSAPAKRLRGDLELLPMIAEQNLAFAAKDISQAGLLGTTVMLLESSQVGAKINLSNIPKPIEVDWLDWLCCFPSFGYLLTTPTDKVDTLIDTFKSRDIHAARIGTISEEKTMRVQYQDQTEMFWNIETQTLTGMNNTLQENSKENPDQLSTSYPPSPPTQKEVNHA